MFSKIHAGNLAIIIVTSLLYMVTYLTQVSLTQLCYGKLQVKVISTTFRNSSYFKPNCCYFSFTQGFLTWPKSPNRFLVELTADKHDTNGEDLLRVGVWGDVPKPYAGQTTESEVQSCDIFISNRRTRPDDGVIVRLPQLITQIVQPADPS